MPASDVANRNFQSPLNFEFSVDRLTDFNYFVQKVNLPSLDIPVADNGGVNPFTRIKVTGDHITFGELQVDFKVDEGMKNWFEIYSWMRGVSYPESQEQYKQLRDGTTPNLDGVVPQPILPGITGRVYGQGVLLINTSQNNPYLRMAFVDMYPTNLSEAVFDTRDTDVNYVTCTVTFTFNYLTVEKIVV